MDFATIKQIFPQARIVDTPNAQESAHLYPYKNKWIDIPDHVTEREEKLLQVLLEEDNETTPVHSESKWLAYLMGESDHIPESASSIRLIQLNLDVKDEDFAREVWLESVRSLLAPVEDAFFSSEDTCLIIQDKEAAFYSHDEIHGILQTLEEDFSLRSICYIGQYWQVNDQLRHLLNEERTMFMEESTHLTDRIASLSDIALRYFTKKALNQSVLMTELTHMLEEHEDWKEIIECLWENQGNVSVTAKSLYIHRNTLQYRMDKFYEQTGLSLKNINELLLCYLLTL